MIKRIVVLLLRWTWRAMAVLGVVVCIAAVVGRSADEWTAVGSDKEEIWYPSPDGTLVAKYRWESGGGGISPFCIESIYVYPAKLAHLADVRPRDYQVYQSNCASVAIRGSAHLEWRGDDLLRIRVKVAQMRAEQTKDREVDVEFEVGR